MANVQRIHLGSETAPVRQGRSAHGQWRVAYQCATASGARPAALHLVQDSNRLAFVLAAGPAAELLSTRLADYLWTRDETVDDWPQNVRDWLANTAQWADAPAGATGFLCGRIERGVAGGRALLAWLGMNGVRVLDRAGNDVRLDTVLSGGEAWTPARGPEPAGMALHAYRGALFGLERLIVFTESARPLGEELVDLSTPELQRGLEDWAEEAEGDLVIFDLRLTPVLTEPTSVVLVYRWVSPELCELSWTPSPNATAYRVEQSSSPTFEEVTLLAELTDVRQVRYTFSPPATGRIYYRVVPLNQGMRGLPSEAISVTPMALTSPVLEPIQWSDDGGYTLTWTPIPQATSYEVQSSPDQDFEAPNTEIVYRGENAEALLPRDTPPNRYYRVRAINAIYAPHTPSPWSRARRSPSRLNTPTFTEVNQHRLAWTPVPGARQYVVHVTPKGQDEASGEDFYTIEPTCAVADEPAVYRVRALRQPDDLRTASEWSDSVTLTPPDVIGSPAQPSFHLTWPVLLITALTVALVGMALGWGGLSAYQNYKATSTRTPIPQTMIQATTAVAATQVHNATAVVQLGMENDMLLGQVNRLDDQNETLRVTVEAGQQFHRALTVTADAMTAAAAQWTATPTPSATPNLTETVEVAVAAAQSATAAQWTDTPTPTVTVTPSLTPNLTETVEAAVAIAQSATAAQWTDTPPPTLTPVPSATPNLTQTVEAAVMAAQTATAARWTNTPRPTATVAPSLTPNLTQTVEAAVIAAQTATAARWTATPTPSRTPRPSAAPDLTATVHALLPPGCFILNRPAAPLPVYARRGESTSITGEARPLTEVIGRLEVRSYRTGDLLEVWLKVNAIEAGGIVIGWIRLPDDLSEADLYGGPACDPTIHVPTERVYE